MFRPTKETAPAVSFVFLINMNEPTSHYSACSYCGDAPINHNLHYVESLASSAFEFYAAFVSKITPAFLKRFAELIPIGLFKTLVFLRLAKFSSDIEKSASFRSRVIWEEAQRRGIDMQQIIFRNRPLDWYRASLPSKTIYFESLPIRLTDFSKDWDNKIILKRELSKHNIPVPKYVGLSFPSFNNHERVFDNLTMPVIIKPKLGSRGRHTITNISNLEQFKNAIAISNQISAHLVVEEHLEGSICRATVVDGVLAGFYQGIPPFIVGDGQKTIRELIEEKNLNRPNRIGLINISIELQDHIARFGFEIDDILPNNFLLKLSHRQGRLFGGVTKEMIDELHPSFVPIIQKAAIVTGLQIAGFDCIIPDPTKDALSQRWGIIECNTLPFIDLHYYALEGKPRNIASMVWDLWK